jgi:hypothetical protein
MTVTITYDENFQYGLIDVYFSGIASTDSTHEKQAADFEDLISMIEEDDFLLDMVEDGIYIKERRIFEKNGALHGFYSGVFRNLNIDGERLREEDNGHVLQIDVDQGDKITSNGRIYQDTDSSSIFWPKDTTKLVYTIKKSFDHNVYSLMQFFEAEKQ